MTTHRLHIYAKHMRSRIIVY